MMLKIFQLVFLCVTIAAIGHAHSSNDAIYEKYEEAKHLLNDCKSFYSPQDKWKAEECYDKVQELCEDICPTDDCPTKVTNIQVKVQDEIEDLDLTIGPPPGTEVCSCELGEEYRPMVAKYNYSIQNNTKDAIAWNDRGAFFAEKCCFDEALRSFDEAIHINPQLADPWYNKGVLIYEEEPLEALECFNQSIAINSEFAEAWFNRCSLLLSLEIDLESPTGIEAQQSYNRALELKPELGDYTPPYLVFQRIG